ncbi:hypothetical protein Tco_0573694 [Tanacetum coccineum]
MGTGLKYALDELVQVSFDGTFNQATVFHPFKTLPKNIDHGSIMPKRNDGARLENKRSSFSSNGFKCRLMVKISMYYDYGAHVKGEILVLMKNSQSVNLLIFILNTLIELFNDFGFDCDGIPKRPTMYLNLWSYKAVRHRYSNPMIQPEPEGSTQGYPLVSVEVLRYDTKGEKVRIKGRVRTEMELLLE